MSCSRFSGITAVGAEIFAEVRLLVEKLRLSDPRVVAKESLNERANTEIFVFIINLWPISEFDTARMVRYVL